MPHLFARDDPIEGRNFEVPDVPRCASGKSHRFTVAGAPWLACEDHSVHGPALLFLGPGIMRRVRRYPPNWNTLDDDALYALSWSR